MPDMTDTSQAIGVAKIVKLGADTLLLVELKNAASIPEGELIIKRIDSVAPDSPSGASCGVQIVVG